MHIPHGQEPEEGTSKELEIAHAEAGLLRKSSEEGLMKWVLTFESLVARFLLEILAALLTQRQQQRSYFH